MTTPPPARPAAPPGSYHASQQRCLLATARLAPGAKAAAVAEIFKRCRDRHQQLAITGTMLFDGERFGYLLCGGSAQVSTAFDAVTGDARQALMAVLADGIDVPSWAARGWRSGWCEPDALADWVAAGAPRDGAALQAWRQLIAASDLL